MNSRLAFTLGLAAVVSVGTLGAQQFRYPPGDHRHNSHVRERASTSVVRHLTRHVGLPEVSAQPGDDPCRDTGWDDDNYRACEVREYTLPSGPLTVEGGRNGGIRVEGWDRSEIHILAIVSANAREEADAKRLVSEVDVQAGSGRVTATGPSTRNREHWSVSYRIQVPKRNDLDLKASNGGITINDVSGTIRFDTTNGGVRLSDVGGDVRGETRNGGLNVTLAGDRWDGTGLDVQTSNGGVTLTIPDGYNAQLTTQTVNGGFRTDYPMTLQGELSPRRGISTTLGAGGPPVSVRTTNGGVRINRR
jgi:hypothetical protein